MCPKLYPWFLSVLKVSFSIFQRAACPHDPIDIVLIQGDIGNPAETFGDFTAYLPVFEDVVAIFPVVAGNRLRRRKGTMGAEPGGKGT